MTALVNTETGEIISEDQVRASVRRVIDHAESIWDEWAWQVENRTWTVLGYANWDEMRRGEYGALTSVSAPRAERPELISRFRGAGLTQKQTADTLGVSRDTVKRHDEPTYQPREPKGANAPFAEDIVDAEIVEDDEPNNVVSFSAPPSRATPRPMAEKSMNLIALYAGKAARAANDLTPEQIRRIRPEAGAWTADLRNSIEALQRLVDSLDN